MWCGVQEVAQGRIWSGQRALEKGLVDVVGGISTAIELAKQAAEISAKEKVTVLEVSRAPFSPTALLGGGGASLGMVAQLAKVLLVQTSMANAIAGVLAVAAAENGGQQGVLAGMAAASNQLGGQPSYMPDAFEMSALNSIGTSVQGASAAAGSDDSSSESFLEADDRASWNMKIQQLFDNVL